MTGGYTTTVGGGGGSPDNRRRSRHHRGTHHSSGHYRDKEILVVPFNTGNHINFYQVRSGLVV
jgi:hypothetical protein